MNTVSETRPHNYRSGSRDGQAEIPFERAPSLIDSDSPTLQNLPLGASSPPRKGLAELPSHFRHGPDAPYDDLNSERKNYLERVAQRIGRIPPRPMCRGCWLRITLTKGRSNRAPLASSRRAHLCGFNLFRCLGK